MGVMPANGLSQEILVLAEQDTTQCGRPVKKDGIGKTRGSILLRGEDIHPMDTESVSNRFGNMDVHVEGETQGSWPSARNRLRKVDWLASCAMRSTSCSSRSIARSMSR